MNGDQDRWKLMVPVTAYPFLPTPIIFMVYGFSNSKRLLDVLTRAQSPLRSNSLALTYLSLLGRPRSVSSLRWSIPTGANVTRAPTREQRRSQSSWALTALKNPPEILELWKSRESAFLAVDFEWSERDPSMITEVGYAGLTSAQVNADGLWPPEPYRDYRCGHFAIEEYVDKDFTANWHCPTYPWSYSFGNTRRTPMSEIGDRLNGVIEELTQQFARNLVIVAHHGGSDLKRLASLNVVAPPSTVFVDTCFYELELFKSGLRTRPESALPVSPSSRSSVPRITNFIGMESLEGIDKDTLEAALFGGSRRKQLRKPAPKKLPLKALLKSLGLRIYDPPPPHPLNPGSWTSPPSGDPLLAKEQGYVLHNAGNDAYLTLYAFQRLVDPERTPSASGPE